MSYLRARIEQETEESAYRVYSSDALKVLTENTQRLLGGSAMGKRYADILDTGTQDKRSAEEVAEDIIARAGLIRGA